MAWLQLAIDTYRHHAGLTFDRCCITPATRRPVRRRSIAHSSAEQRAHIPRAGGVKQMPAGCPRHGRLAAAGARKQQLSSGSSPKPKPGKPPHLCGTPCGFSHRTMVSHMHTPLCKHSRHPCSTSQPTALSVAMVSSQSSGNFSPKHPPPLLPPVGFQGGEGAHEPWLSPFWTMHIWRLASIKAVHKPLKPILWDHQMTGAAKRRVGNVVYEEVTET